MSWLAGACCLLGGLLPQDVRAQADASLAHYWDGVDFADTVLFAKEELLTKAFVRYVALFGQADSAEIDTSVSGLLSRASSSSVAYRSLGRAAEQVLDDPNSPFRNEAYYLPFLARMRHADLLSSAERQRLQMRYRMALQNRPGSRAADFPFTLSDGRTCHLSDVKAEYVLLFLNNPDCKACSEMIVDLMRSRLLVRLQEEGRLKIVAVYPDSDEELWEQYAALYPIGWVIGYDAERNIMELELYDLRAIPSLYLLDGRMRVLLKDAGLERIEAFLHDR